MQSFFNAAPRPGSINFTALPRWTQSRFRLYSATTTFVKRVTLFKIPVEKDIQAVLKAYDVLRQSATRDGQAYVISNTSRRVLNTESAISDGFTVMAQSIFRNHSDHDYYDKECPAHKILKKTTGPAKTGVLTIVTEGEWPEPRL